MPAEPRLPARSRAPAHLAHGAGGAAATLLFTAVELPARVSAPTFTVPAAAAFVTGWAAVALAARARRPRRAAALACAFAGVLVGSAYAGAGAGAEAGGTLLALPLGALFGAGLGMSTWAILPRAPTGTPGADIPTTDAPDRSLVKAVFWLAGWTAVMYAWRGEAPVVTAAALASLALGGPALLLVLARDLHRVLWLGAVARGRVRAYAVVPDDGGEPPDPPIPLFAMYDESDIEGYLVRRAGGAGPSPFREGAQATPIAELPCDPALARAPFLRRAALCVVTLALLAAVLAPHLRAHGLLPG